MVHLKSQEKPDEILYTFTQKKYKTNQTPLHKIHASEEAPVCLAQILWFVVIKNMLFLGGDKFLH